MEKHYNSTLVATTCKLASRCMCSSSWLNAWWASHNFFFQWCFNQKNQVMLTIAASLNDCNICRRYLYQQGAATYGEHIPPSWVTNSWFNQRTQQTELFSVMLITAGVPLVWKSDHKCLWKWDCTASRTENVICSLKLSVRCFVLSSTCNALASFASQDIFQYKAVYLSSMPDPHSLSINSVLSPCKLPLHGMVFTVLPLNLFGTM